MLNHTFDKSFYLPNDINQIRFALESGQATEKDLINGAITAIYSNQYAIFEFLIEHGTNIFHYPMLNGCVLMNALLRADNTTWMGIIDDYHPNWMQYKDDEGNNVLHILASTPYANYPPLSAEQIAANVHICKTIPLITTPNNAGDLPIHTAASRRNRYSMEFLMRLDANYLIQNLPPGSYALTMNPEEVDPGSAPPVFLAHGSACLACRNHTGDDAVILAARAQEWNCIHFFLDRYPHMHDTTDDAGNNILHIMADVFSKNRHTTKHPKGLITRLAHLTLEQNLEGFLPVDFTQKGSPLRQMFLDAEEKARQKKVGNNTTHQGLHAFPHTPQGPA